MFKYVNNPNFSKLINFAKTLNCKITPTLKFTPHLSKSSFSSYGDNFYIPNKQLLFINHPKHGKVYPVYIADSEYNKKHNPKKYLPLTFLFTGFNLFLLLSGMQVLPLTTVYALAYSNDMFLLTSIIFNYLLLRKYFKFVGNYDSRVKCLYLEPSGDKLILEFFDGTIKKFDNFDIYEFSIRNKFSDMMTKTIKWNPLRVNNDNSFRCSIRWGRNNENYFEGKSIIFDYEIFSQIVSRTNIETNITKFKKQMPLGYYSQQDKLKVLKNFGNRRWIKKINRNRLHYWYKLLRKKYVDKPKKKILKEEFNFY
jgi:hypothetical protein